MAFGDAAVIDDFNRSDRSLAGDNGWSGPLWSADQAAAIISNVVGGATSSLWYGAYRGSFSGDVEAWATIPTVTTAREFAIWIHITNGNTSSPQGYRVLWVNSTTGSIQRCDSGSQSTLTTFNTSLSNGDALGIEKIGNTITAYKKPSGGSWGSVATVASDTTYTSGAIGFEFEHTTWRLDDFGGGAPGAAAGQPTAARWQNIPFAGPRLRIGGL
jgi:hypothetical protein